MLTEILTYPGVPQPSDVPDETPLLPIIPVRFVRDGREFAYFSTVTTFGTPQDITLQELRIECFHPVDTATQHMAQALASRS
jgi:hypothetical protein